MSAITTAIPERDALYYPYINVRDENWLKATLLSFPHVHRITPGFLPTDDRDSIKPYIVTQGPDGRNLLQEKHTHDNVVLQEQGRLLKYLESRERNDLRPFSRASTEVAPAHRPFRIHVGKLSPLLDFFRSCDCAWPADGEDEKYPQWVCVHPRLGEAVMSNIALALASEYGLDIVTDEPHTHGRVTAQTQDDVLTGLFGPSHATRTDTLEDKVHELTAVVMSTGFDLHALNYDDIQRLLGDGKDLRKFKTHIATLAAELPAIPNPDERKQRFEAKAHEIIADWQKYKSGLRGHMAQAFAAAAELKIADIINQLTAIGVTCTVSEVGAVGLGVFLLTINARKVYKEYVEKKSSPLAYLSRIEKAGGVLATSFQSPSPA